MTTDGPFVIKATGALGGIGLPGAPPSLILPPSHSFSRAPIRPLTPPLTPTHTLPLLHTLSITVSPSHPFHSLAPSHPLSPILTSSIHLRTIQICPRQWREIHREHRQQSNPPRLRCQSTTTTPSSFPLRINRTRRRVKNLPNFSISIHFFFLVFFFGTIQYVGENFQFIATAKCRFFHCFHAETRLSSNPETNTGHEYRR